MIESAGLLLYRGGPDGAVQVLLGHMGGPFWARKDAGAWSMPKGELAADEPAEVAAAREFAEELGSPPPAGELVALGTLKVTSGKRLTAFALHGDFDVSTVRSNTFTITWPPRSGRIQEFPEIDRAEWFDLPTAREKITTGQVGFLDRLAEALRRPPPDGVASPVTPGDDTTGPGGT